MPLPTAARTISSSWGVQGPLTSPSLRTFPHRSAHWASDRAPLKASFDILAQSQEWLGPIDSTVHLSFSSSRFVHRPVFAAAGDEEVDTAVDAPPRCGVTTRLHAPNVCRIGFGNAFALSNMWGS